MKRDLCKAFTLIELLIVLAILSTLFFIVTPRFISSVNPEKTKNFVSRMQNSLVYLNEKSILDQKVYLFTIDLDERTYSFTVSEEGNPEGVVRDRYLNSVSFPAHLSVKSIKVVPGEEIREGKASLPFTPNGMLFSFDILVEEKEDRHYIVRGNSFSNTIQVLKVTEEEEELLY
jgi:prepilin-type N-terminal cleavage/methylation domain-containing protein